MRDIIERNEGKLTALRVIGFILLIAGTTSLIICSFATWDHIPNVVAVSFFVTMLGFSLAFPTVLEGNEGLSTMRIVVFMMTNVICMLLLKIGWAAGITSLEQIGLDGYWVGIIAFTFGAKATQSFFESKLAVPKASQGGGASSLTFSNAEIARLAVIQNEDYLKVKFLNILTISDAVDNPNEPDNHVVVIYLKDSNDLGIPVSLDVKMPDGSLKRIATEIVKGSGTAKIQYSQLNSDIAAQKAQNYLGSICCGVKTSDGLFKGVLTSAHILTHGNYTEIYNGYLNPPQQTKVLISGMAIAKWHFKMLSKNQDLAVAQFSQPDAEDSNYRSFNNEFYTIENKDVKTDASNITMLSKNHKETKAFIIDYNIGLDVDYNGVPYYKTNVILIGTTNNRQTCRPVSVGGDSGSCIYHTQTGKLIGMLLGRADNFSLVLPIQATLKALNLQTI